MLKITLKFLLAFALCYWLFTNGKLDFSLVSKSFHLGYLWILGVILFILRILINSLRFQNLLQAKSLNRISFLKVLSFDAVGSFFSVILPGSVAGDVVRFFYYKKLDQKLTPPTIGSLIILDRLMGLSGLLILGVFVGIWQFESLKNLNPALVSLIYFNIFLLMASTTIVLIIFSNLFSLESLLRFSQFLSRWPKVAGVFNEMLSLKMTSTDLIKSLILSILGQLASIGSFWALASPFIPESISFLNVFTIIPIGFIGTSLPITPAGLGVGHLVFENLFSMLHIDHGASLFNLYFIVLVSISLLGVFPYIFIKSDENCHTTMVITFFISIFIS